ncbi:pyridoxal phosphate homeostasis protein-like [Pollicipes pollicipes]|uniref:pyridoxal phosphate homeostasis protein-like n=1 Tax=Pollicipes pollicipes TaxID=41117 RepID=UPI0018849246|nr:pyridoxal phosphate homeostasis protein-like [Pollicipes pollicipes]
MLRRNWRMFSVVRNVGKMSEIGQRLGSVLEKVRSAGRERPQELQYSVPRLVAVSKTKPVKDIIEAYHAGQRVFGENYVNELVEKAMDPKLLELCPDIRWHFIGRLQRNKVSKVARLAALSMVETLDSPRLADALNAAREKADLDPLGVMVQVNTSGEQSKGGVQAVEVASLVRHVQQQCPALVLTGLMTIGAYNHDMAIGPNPDFERLLRCREEVCKELDLSPRHMELSMGMSADYEHAILVGSTNVRVGSEIFGVRQYKGTSSSAEPAAPTPGPAGVDALPPAGPADGAAGAAAGTQSAQARLSAVQ